MNGGRVVVVEDRTNEVIRNLKALESFHVVVGVPEAENARQDGPIGNAVLAYIHDNGSPRSNIPARPFMIPGIRKATPKIIKVMAAYAAKGLDDPKQTEKGLSAIGTVARDAIKSVIVSQQGFARLSPRTLAARRRIGFSGTKALIHTASMLNSITYAVRSGKPKKG